jgi:hypothetical protein
MGKEASARGWVGLLVLVLSKSGAKLRGTAASPTRAGAAGVPVDVPSPRHITGRVLRDARSRGRGERRPYAGGVPARGSACRTAASYALGCGLHVELVHVGADDQGAKLVIRALFSEGAEGGSGAPALVDVDRWGPTMSALTAKSWRPEALRASSTA